MHVNFFIQLRLVLWKDQEDYYNWKAAGKNVPYIFR